MTVSATLIALAVVSAIVYALTLVATWRFYRRSSSSAIYAQLPGVSLLKPIHGLVESLEQNLQSAYEQDYPGGLEVIVTASTPHDAAVEVARRVAARFPTIRTSFVFADRRNALNPKVASLIPACATARHELLLQTDDNVYLPPDYLRQIVSEMLATDAALLSNPVVGVGEQSIGATLENLQLTTATAPALCAAHHVLEIPAVVGKSMLMKRASLEALGGFASVGDVLAEDYVLGKRFAEAGEKVVLSTTPIRNVNHRTTVRAFLSRHTRWLRLRAALHPAALLYELLANPLPLVLLAFITSGGAYGTGPFLLGTLVARVGFDSVLMQRLRGSSLGLRHLWLIPARDLLMLGIWVCAVLSRKVSWRGSRLRVGTETRLAPQYVGRANRQLQTLRTR